jgi:FkbM family methyltransferase
MRSSEISRESKWRLFGEKIKWFAGLHPRSDVPVRVGAETVFLGADSYATDWDVLRQIFIEGEYRAGRYDAVSVLDLGAHKGYFAAYALARGAARVISYEPEPANFALLARASARSAHWDVRKAAIAAASGKVDLALDTSWTHSIFANNYPAAPTISVEAVGLEDALRGITGDRIMVKVDIEGAEGAAIAAVPLDAWDRVAEVIIEIHPWACDSSQIIDLLSNASLLQSRSPDLPELVFRFTRC